MIKFDLGTSAEASSSPKRYSLLLDEEDGIPPLLLTVEADDERFVCLAGASAELEFWEREGLRADIAALARRALADLGRAAASAPAVEDTTELLLSAVRPTFAAWGARGVSPLLVLGQEPDNRFVWACPPEGCFTLEDLHGCLLAFLSDVEQKRREQAAARGAPPPPRIVH